MQVCSALTVDTPASNMILPFNRDLAWVRDPCGCTHTSFTDSSCLRDSSDEHAARNNLVKSREIFDFVPGILHKFRLHPAVLPPTRQWEVHFLFLKSPSAFGGLGIGHGIGANGSINGFSVAKYPCVLYCHVLVTLPPGTNWRSSKIFDRRGLREPDILTHIGDW